jgi:regulatory protein
MADYEKIIARAAKICSTAEKCSHDVKTKMISWGLDEEEADRAISYLVEQKFIDDARFARYFVKDKLKFNKWGRIKISYALRQKQLPDHVINEALREINEETYIEILDQLVMQKIRSAGNMNVAANKAKVLRFAAQKGFTAEEVYRSLDRVRER